MTDIVTTPTEPSSPDPALVTLVMSLLRWLLTLLSAAGIVTGLKLSDSVLMILASALVGIGTAIWGIVAWVKAKRRDHLGNVISARQGVPLQPKQGGV